MKRFLSVLTLLACAVMAGPASAHMLWVTTTESFAHPPGHAISQLGFGHVLPIDDLLSGDFGTIALVKYELVGPDGSSFDLGLPDLTASKGKTSPTGMVVNTGDLGLRKIACTKDSAQGTHQVVAQSKPMFFTMYVDKKGKQRMAPKSMDAIKDLKTVRSCTKYEAFAKSFFTLGEWTEPTPLNHELEIIPLTDLSDVHAGDLVSFKVSYKGTPLGTSDKGIQRMTCASNTFGGPDGFQLDCYLMNGIAKFRMPTAGQWVGNVYFKQEVNNDPKLKDLKGKCTQVYTAASVTFTVKP